MLDHVPLRLFANDTKHLSIFSAYLQDALIPLSSLHFQKEKGLFSCLLNRFCWEHLGTGTYYRVHTGLIFEKVIRIQRRNFHHHSEERILNLLILGGAREEGTFVINLLFSDDKEIRIYMEDPISIKAHDVDEIWITKKRPLHPHDY